MAADPETQRRCPLRDACQIGFDDESPLAQHAHFDQVWHHD